MEEDQEDAGGPLNLDPAMYSQESDDESTPCQEMPLCNIGADMQEYLDIPFQVTKQNEEILLDQFKTAYQRVFEEISNSTGVLAAIPKELMHGERTRKKGRKGRAADDIIEAITLTIVER